MRECENCSKELKRKNKRFCNKNCQRKYEFDNSFRIIGGVIEFDTGKRNFWNRSEILDILKELEKCGVNEVKLRFNEPT